MSVNARMMPIEALVFLIRQKRRSGAKFGEIRNMVAPSELGDGKKRPGIADDRRKNVFEDVTKLVGRFAAHNEKCIEPEFNNN